MTSIQTLSDDVQNDLDALLGQLSPEIYAQPLPVLSGATLGQHVRHILEGYQSLGESLASGILDYDARRRDRRLETDLGFARTALQALTAAFANVAPEAPLTLRQTYAAEAPLTVETSVGRELMYNLEHAIHHMALLRIGIEQSFPAVVLPTHFGVAYATVRHRQTTA